MQSRPGAVPRVKPIHCLVFASMLLSGASALGECTENAAVSVQVLGSGGPEWGDGRASSGYLIWRGAEAVIMVDAGSGSALNFEKSDASLTDLKAVLFTHFHVDHSADFPSLVKASYFTERRMNLPVFGPSGNALMPSATAFVAKLLGENGAFRYLNSYIADDVKENYKIEVTNVPLASRRIHHYDIDPDIRASAVPVHHGPLPAIAWRVDIAGCSISFSGDMSNQFGTIEQLARGSDLLVAHNAVPEGATGAARSLHMPPSEIGKIANEAGVGMLVLSHRMQRTLGRERESENEIRKHFAGPLAFADDLDRFAVGSIRD